MFSLGAIGFATPLALLGLLVLPVIWYLLAFTPPKPESVRFAPFRLLLGLIPNEEETDKTPWWLLALRLAMAAMIILAVAAPFLGTGGDLELKKSPVLIVVDDDWAAAKNWGKRKSVLVETIQAAARVDAPVALVLASQASTDFSIKQQSARDAMQLAGAFKPLAVDIDREKLARRLKDEFGKVADLQIVWLSNGLGGARNKEFAAQLGSLASWLTIYENYDLPLVLGKPEISNAAISVKVFRQDVTKSMPVGLVLQAANGRNLAQVDHLIEANKASSMVSIKLPLALRNEAARISIVKAQTAAGTWLLDDRFKRKTVGIVSSSTLEMAQPLLSPMHYVNRALEPYAEILEPQSGDTISGFMEQGLSMLVLADVGMIAPKTRGQLTKWVKDGGVLLRFSGPHLAANVRADDNLIPVVLRRGGRALGSALSWEQPQGLAAFSDDSPLRNIALDKTVKISRQILAEPVPELAGRVWASLADGTPLITAKRSGSGLIILVHVTANSDWSNLPLSGMFVEILKAIIDLAPAITSAKPQIETVADKKSGWVPVEMLDGFGQIVSPPARAEPVSDEKIATQRPSTIHPAGMYKRGSAMRAINMNIDPARLKRLDFGGARPYEPQPATPLAGYLFVAAFILFLADCIAALSLTGAWSRLRGGLTVAALFMLMSGGEHITRAQELNPADQFAMDAVLETRFAYVITGDEQVDAVSKAGLLGLSMALEQRTSVEPGNPVGVDLEKDEIAFFPFIYWPVTADSKPPSLPVYQKLADFMQHGGTVFFDTRDHTTSMYSLMNATTPETLALRAILGNLDIPALEPVPEKHVLTRSFYLLSSFPGRYAGGKLWVQSQSGNAGNSDGVSPIIIGSNNYAAAWAVDGMGRPLYAVIPGLPRQREYAYRTGINIAMYMLTGNYKADQVHVPALLERLGQ